MHDTLIYWAIHTLDRNRTKPFPLDCRIWYLEWDRVPEQARKEILNILQAHHTDDSMNDVRSKPGDSEATLTFTQGDLRMLQYRKYFHRRPGFDINTSLQQPGTPLKHLIPVNLGVEYFEDEAGNPMSKIDIYGAKTGQKDPLIPFYPESVLRLGPSSIHLSHQPNQDDSNTIAHFLETVDYVARSSWFRSPPALTFRTQDEKSHLDSSFPNPSETQGVLLALRQLYASDKLFDKALKSYLRICGEPRKVEWTNQIKRAFDKFLEGSGFLPVDSMVNVRELLDAFLYGSRIAHSHERDKQERLQSLISAHGRPQVIMAVHAAFRQLMNFALYAFPVVKQDFEHWLETGQCPKQNGMSIGELLSSGRAEANTGQKSRTKPRPS